MKWKSFIWLTPKSSSLVIGMYYIVLSIVIFILSCAGLSLINPINLMKEIGKKEATEGDEVLLEGIVPAKLLLSVLILTSLLMFVTNIMMLIGVTQDKPLWVYIWLNSTVFIVGVHILVCFCNMALELPDDTQKNIAIYLSVTNIMVSLYFLVVVNNFYIDMDNIVPMGYYVDNPYSFMKNHGLQRFSH